MCMDNMEFDAGIAAELPDDGKLRGGVAELIKKDHGKLELPA